MKTIKSILVCNFMFIAVTSASAQFGLGNNGMGRQQGQSQGVPVDPNRYTKSPEIIEKEQLDAINKSVEKLKTDLNLDELQLIVIRKEIESSSKSINAVIKSDVSIDEKALAIEAISEKTDRTINTYLNKEQKEKYKKFMEEKKEKLDKIKDKRLR
jgi:hypothetical protein